MAIYTPDFSKSPLELLLGLINVDNNFGLTATDIALKDLTVLETPVQKTVTLDDLSTVTIDLDTSISIDLLTNEVQDDFTEFKYRRIDLATLFSAVNPYVREVDVPLDESGVPQDVNVFLAEFQRRYGVAINTADFDIGLESVSGGGVDNQYYKYTLSITAKASNLAYVGKITVPVVASLASRVATVELDGFSSTSIAPAV